MHSVYIPCIVWVCRIFTFVTFVVCVGSVNFTVNSNSINSKLFFLDQDDVSKT